MRARLAVAIVTSLLATGCSSTAQPTGQPTPSSPATVSPVGSPSPSIAPPSTAAESAAPSATSIAWQEVAQTSGGQLAGFSGGYVALANQSVSTKILFSPDGLSWQVVSLPFRSSKDARGNVLEAQAEGLASNGSQVLVVGGYFHGPCAVQSPGATGGGPACPSSPIAWLTSDGTHWQSSYPWPGPGPAKGDLQGNEFTSVWSIPGSGWDAASMDIGGEGGASGGLFHSADGLSWTKVASPSANHAGSQPLEFWHLGLADATGRRLMGGYWYPNGNPLLGLFTSADGKAWSAVSSFQGANVTAISGVAPIDSLRPLWIIAGADASSLPTVWTSPDLATWTAHELPALPGAQGSLNSIAATHLGYVAAGQLSDGTDGSAYHSSWVSTDGISWTQIDTPRTAHGDGPDVLADGPGGVIGFALYNGVSTPIGAWQLK